MLTQQAVPLLLVIFIGFAAYSSIFLSLKNLQREFKAKEENQKMQAERDYLHLAADGMTKRLKLMEEISVQNSRASHDCRHFNNMLLELLEQGDIGEAISLLKKQNKSAPKISKVYCENPAVNAAVCHYANMASNANILTEIELDIPSNIGVDSLEFSMAVSNMMASLCLILKMEFFGFDY